MCPKVVKGTQVWFNRMDMSVDSQNAGLAKKWNAENGGAIDPTIGVLLTDAAYLACPPR